MEDGRAVPPKLTHDRWPPGHFHVSFESDSTRDPTPRGVCAGDRPTLPGSLPAVTHTPPRRICLASKLDLPWSCRDPSPDPELRSAACFLLGPRPSLSHHWVAFHEAGGTQLRRRSQKNEQGEKGCWGGALTP